MIRWFRSFGWLRIAPVRDLDAPCDLPPKGWRCYLPRGHDGPCPAWPVSRRARRQSRPTHDDGPCHRHDHR